MAEFGLWMLESSLLVLMILGIRKAFTGKISYAAVYALWLVAALRFLVPVNIIPTPFGVGTMVSDAVSSWKASEAEKTKVSVEKAEDTGKALRGNGKSVAVKPAVKNNHTGKGEVLITGNSKNTEPVKILYSGKHTKSSWGAKLKGLPWKRISIAGWISIAGIVFLFFVWSNISLMNRLKRNRRHLGQRGNVAVYATGVLQTPCLYGVLRPVIYLPENLLDRAQEEIEQMVMHEYVHYLHRDYIWAMIRILLLCVYWFDPFVWIAVSCSKKDAELFCDETVIRILGEDKRLGYGALLIQIAGEHHWGDFRYSMMPMSRKGREMKRRILAISQPKSYSRWIVVPVVAIVGASVLLTCSTGIGMAMSRDSIGGMKSASQPAISGEMAGFRTDQLLMERISGISGINMTSNPLLMTSGGEFQVQISVEGAGKNGVSQKVSDEDAVVCRKLFEKYVTIFTESINSGKTGRLKQVLKEGTKVYEQQKALAGNYHKRGIREKVKSCDVDLVKVLNEYEIQINSREQIKVTYGDKTTKLVKQSYCYTCEKKNGSWIITAMDDNISLAK